MAKTKKEEGKTKKRYATHLTTPTGKRVYISAKSQEELEKKVTQAKLEMGAGVNIADTTTFEEYARLWLTTYKKPPKVRETTYAVLQYTVEKNIIPSFEGAALRDVKPMHIQQFLSDISRYSRVVQSRCLQIVKAIFLSAEDNGLILKSPVRASDKVSGEGVKAKEALTNAQAVQLLDAVRGTPAYLFCLIALTTGMRKGEILGLMWEDIDFESGHINVTHSKVVPCGQKDAPVSTLLKSDCARRRLPIPLPLRYALEVEHRNSRSPYVLSMRNGQSLTAAAFQSLWHHVTQRTVSEGRPLGHVPPTAPKGKEYVVTLDFRCHPHLLRHTFITQCFESGMDVKQVQYLAGHSTSAMTLNVYAHYRERERAKETAEQVGTATNYLLAEGSQRQPKAATKMTRSSEKLHLVAL